MEYVEAGSPVSNTAMVVSDKQEQVKEATSGNTVNALYDEKRRLGDKRSHTRQPKRQSEGLRNDPRIKGRRHHHDKKDAKKKDDHHHHHLVVVVISTGFVDSHGTKGTNWRPQTKTSPAKHDQRQ